VHSSVSTIKANKWEPRLTIRQKLSGEMRARMWDQESEGRKYWRRAIGLACAFKIDINAPVNHQSVHHESE
jgi:hypothetical protein